MRLNVDFSLLLRAVENMGAAQIDFDINIQQEELDPIDAELGTSGIQVDFDQIDFNGGLANYEGRQVLIYIPDHSFNVLDVLSKERMGNKFHVSYCRTLKEMRAKGRYFRYTATNKLDGYFNIFGKDDLSADEIKGEAELFVCKNCLTHLNYNGYKNNKANVFDGFSIEEFFSTYSSFFPYMPVGFTENMSGYTNDWKNISSEYKSDRAYICEYCGVDLKEAKKLLHVHHINGVKGDNNQKNLRALCLDCHKKQPSHNHLYVKHEDTILINRLRKKQGCAPPMTWEDIEKLADKGLGGFIDLCKRYRLRLAEVGYSLQGDTVYLDLAWPSEKVAVVLSQKSRDIATSQGWKIWSMIDSIEEFTNLATYVR